MAAMVMTDEPSSPSPFVRHCLTRVRPALTDPGGELRRAFAGWEVWEYEECEAPASEARLLARRPPREGVPGGR